MNAKKKTSRLKKHRLRLGRVMIVGIIAVVLVISMSLLPALGHIKGVRSAVDRYDVEKLAVELAWFDTHAEWLKRLPLIRDGELWLKLSLGEYDGLEERLQAFRDDKHQFWLLQVHLLLGDKEKAQAALAGLESESRHALGEALIEVYAGDHLNARKKLELTGDSGLSLEERVLKAITSARVEMALNNDKGAQAAWAEAKKLAAEHPLVQETEWDLALAEGQWGRALELSDQLTSLSGNTSRRELLLTKKALLALTVGERRVYEETVSQLTGQKNGEALISYLAGNEHYAQGDFKGASERLQNALKLGLPDAVRDDAESALKQVNERVQAELALSNLS